MDLQAEQPSNPADVISHPANRWFDDMPDLLTMQEACDYFQVAEETMRYWRKIGSAPRAIKVGKHLRFRRADLVAFVEQRSA